MQLPALQSNLKASNFIKASAAAAAAAAKAAACREAVQLQAAAAWGGVNT
jgi:hypothetical protein